MRIILVVGESFKHINEHNLKYAKKLFNKNEIAQDIFDETGFYIGPDAKWRTIILDKGASLDEDIAAVEGCELNVNLQIKDVLNHKELFEGYPDLLDYTVHFDSNLETQGAVNHQAKRISVKTPFNAEDLRKTLLHELQHAVQSIEDFYAGASHSHEKLKKKYMEYPEDKLADVKEFLEQSEKERLSEEQIDYVAHILQDTQYDLRYSLAKNTKSIILKDIEEKRIDKTDFNYFHAYGEIESRFTELTSNSNQTYFPDHSLVPYNMNFISQDGTNETAKYNGGYDLIRFINKMEQASGAKVSLGNNECGSLVKYDEEKDKWIVNESDFFGESYNICEKIKQELYLKAVVPEGLKTIFGEDYKKNISKIESIINKEDEDYIQLRDQDKLKDDELVENYIFKKIRKEEKTKPERNFLDKVGTMIKMSVKKAFNLEINENDILDVMGSIKSKTTVKNFLKEKLFKNIDDSKKEHKFKI